MPPHGLGRRWGAVGPELEESATHGLAPVARAGLAAPPIDWSTKTAPAKAEKTVGELMRPAVVVPGGLPLEAVLQMMAEEQVPMVLVVGENDDLLGTLWQEDAEAALDQDSTRDRAVKELRELIGNGFSVESVLTAMEVMEPYVQVARPSWPASRALALMKREGVRMVPVVVEGDSQAIGVIGLSHLESAGTSTVALPESEPRGTYRDVFRLKMTERGQNRHSLTELAEHIARSWLRTRAVDPADSAAVTFAEVMLPVLSDLYDDLVEHYSDFQEGELLSEALEGRPELWVWAQRLGSRQADALALVSGLLERVRHERRPDRALLARIEAMAEELRAIDEAENDLFYEARYVDVAAVD